LPAEYRQAVRVHDTVLAARLRAETALPAEQDPSLEPLARAVAQTRDELQPWPPAAQAATVAQQAAGDVHIGRATVVTDAAVLVFREGLEAVLILAAITASFTGARRRLRRPVLLGGLAGLAATLAVGGVTFAAQLLAPTVVLGSYFAARELNAPQRRSRRRADRPRRDARASSDSTAAR
jgi:hypothetical protein